MRAKNIEQAAMLGSHVRHSQMTCRAQKIYASGMAAKTSRCSEAFQLLHLLAGAVVLIIAVTTLSYVKAFAADFSAGTEAFSRGDYATAMAEWQPLAKAGNAIAQQNIGFMYYHGFGVAKNPKSALQWFHRAAENGQGESQMMLGVMYANGEGVEASLTESLAWFTIALLTLNESENRKRAMENRTAVARLMSLEEIETAIDRAYAWSTTYRRGRRFPDEIPPLSGSAPEALDVVEAGDDAGDAADINSVKTAATTPPSDDSAPEAAGPGQDQAGFYVQIASFEARSATDAEWHRQNERHKDILEGRKRSVQEAKLADGRVFYRLQIGPFADRGPASKLCEALKRRSQDCFVVRRH